MIKTIVCHIKTPIHNQDIVQIVPIAQVNPNNRLSKTDLNEFKFSKQDFSVDFPTD